MKVRLGEGVGMVRCGQGGVAIGVAMLTAKIEDRSPRFSAPAKKSRLKTWPTTEVTAMEQRRRAGAK